MSNNLKAQDKYTTDIKILEKNNNSSFRSFAISVSGHKTVIESIAVEILFKFIFFRGIQGSPPLKPLLNGSESELFEKHNKYFISFFENKKYNVFIVEKNCSTETYRNKNKICRCVLSVNIQSLSEDLRNNKILYDYGF